MTFSKADTLILKGLNNDQKGVVYRVIQPIIAGRSRSCDIFISDVFKPIFILTVRQKGGGSVALLVYALR